MSAARLAQRLSVFVVFAALAAGALALLRSTPPRAVPSNADLECRERELLAGARLHPALPAPAPAGSAVFCAECHPRPPHAGRHVGAALVNEHAGNMDCLLCHWPAARGARPQLLWRVRSGALPFLTVQPLTLTAKDELARLRAAVTVNRRCFERGPECRACHRRGGIGALLRPDSSPGRLTALENLETYFTLAPGEKWYFPQLQ